MKKIRVAILIPLFVPVLLISACAARGSEPDDCPGEEQMPRARNRPQIRPPDRERQQREEERPGAERGTPGAAPQLPGSGDSQASPPATGAPEPRRGR